MSPSIGVSKGRSSRSLTATLKEKDRRAKQCVNASWLLLRILASQLPGISEDPGPCAAGGPPLNQSTCSSSLLLCRISWSLLLRPVFEVLREETRESILHVRSFTRGPLLAPPPGCNPLGSATGSSGRDDQSQAQNGQHSNANVSDRSGGAGCGNRANLALAHRKRCQELIGNPRRFMNMEDGFVFPAEHLLSNPRGSDFSITFWLYLTQDSTGKYRTILTRGHKAERWPVVMLRDVDRRLEVGFGLSSMSTLCERLTSKDPVPLHKWTHVCLVSEGSKLRLYINGTLDYQRSNMGVPKECKHSLYVGKVPDGAVRLQGVKGGFEGSIASLRYYSRALSPIHVRIVCDQGPPELVRVKDRKCFQMCSVLSLAAASPFGRAHLCSPTWLNLVLYMLIHGTSRVQQAAVRILAKILPHASPEVFASLTLLETLEEDDDGTAPAPAPPQPTVSPDCPAPVRFLLRLVGLALHRTKLDSVSRVYACFRDNKPFPLLGDVTVQGAMTSNETFAHFLPNNLAICCLGRELTHGPPCPDNLPSSTVEGGPDSISYEVVQDTWSLASDIVSLLRRLAMEPAWRVAVSGGLLTAVQSFSVQCIGTDNGPTRQPDQITDDLRLKYAEGVAALSVLGGHTDLVRTGVRVAMQGTDLTGFVIGFDEVACLAHVRLSSRTTASQAPGHPATSLRIAGGKVRDSARMLRVNADDIFVECDLELAVDLWEKQGHGNIFQTIGTSLQGLCRALLQPQQGILPVLDSAMTPFSSGSAPSTGLGLPLGSLMLAPTITPDPIARESASAPVSDKPAPGGCFMLSSLTDCSESIIHPCTIQDAIPAQLRSLLVKIVYAMVSNPEVLQSLFRKPVEAAASKLLDSVILLAIQPDSSPNFMTLEEAELRAVIIRKRLYQLMPHDLEKKTFLRPCRMEASSSSSETSLRHQGTSLLNCPACLMRLPGGLRYNKVLQKDGGRGALHPFDVSTPEKDSEFGNREVRLLMHPVGVGVFLVS
jgi:hypothetical protein